MLRLRRGLLLLSPFTVLAALTGVRSGRASPLLRLKHTHHKYNQHGDVNGRLSANSQYCCEDYRYRWDYPTIPYKYLFFTIQLYYHSSILWMCQYYQTVTLQDPPAAFFPPSVTPATRLLPPSTPLQLPRQSFHFPTGATDPN